MKAGSSKTPTDVIENTGSDLATSLAGKLNVIVEPMKFAVTYGDNITVSPAFASGAEIEAGTQITFTAADRTADSYGFLGFYEESTFDTHITTGVNNQTYTVMVTDAAISVYARYEKYASASYVYPVYNDPYDVTQGVKEDWETETVNAYVVTSSDTPVTWGEDGKTTWYVVTGKDVTLSQGAICAGNVNLILTDGAKLTALGMDDHYNEAYSPGIQVSGAGDSLAIYGQTAQSGQLEAIGTSYVAGIGGGERGSGSNITINGGTVTANGGSFGAGIGGGFRGSGSNITINGGTVTADGGMDAAGIGGGIGGAGSNIAINGGTVTANGDGYGAGIGGGNGDAGSNITINNGVVTAEGGTYAVGIGSGDKGAASSNITVSAILTLEAGGTEIANNGGDLAESLEGKRYVTIRNKPTVSVSYIDEKDVSHNINAYVVTSSGTPVVLGAAGKETWYVVTDAYVELSQGAICKGNVNLILADDAKLTATGADNEAGIRVSDEGNSLTIYGQAAQSGQLIATGGKYSAGIGGGDQGDGSNITINGGVVKANSKSYGAGIGGGNRGAGSNITINGGTVTANGGGGSAGIGGGASGSGSNITINGGTVTANGAGNGAGIGAGIGGGFGGNGSYITINGGTVTATGGLNAAGIGGGYAGPIIFEGGQGSNIIINGGTVTANGGMHAAGIGSGTNGPAASDIFVATILTLKAGGTEIANNGGDLAGSLAGQQYATVSDAVCNITANQDRDNKTYYYSTFYSGKKAYSVPEGVTAYTGTVDGSVLKLTAIAGGIIPAGEPVILRLTATDNTATKQKFALTATTTTATKSTDNKLSGTDVPIAELGANDYALSLGQNGVGFYLWNGKPIDAHKAYLTLTTSVGAKAFTFMFDDGTTTDIESLTPALSEGEGAIYNLNGVRVDGNYKGIVIKNGKKIYQK